MRTISRPKIIGAISAPPYVQSSPPMPDAEGAQSSPAAHRDDSLATNPSAELVTESHPPTRRRRGWERAGIFAAVACLAWLACPTAAFAQALDDEVVITSIAADNKVNASEKSTGFDIAGTTKRPVSGVLQPAPNIPVTVTIDTGSLNATSNAQGDWSVNVPGNAVYITDGVNQTVTAVAIFPTQTLTATAKFDVDLTPPTVTYTAPQSLTVGVAITAIDPTTNDTDIDSYAISSGSLPRGLSLNGTTGVISGRPTTGDPNTQTVAVLATDDAGNTDTAADIEFPAVDGPEPGVKVDPPAADLPPEGLSVPEGGSAGYTLVLATQPTHDVTIGVSRRPGGDTDLTAMPVGLTFTDSNWNTPQAVTVSAAEDSDGVRGIASFEHNAVSADSSYSGIGTPAVKAFEDDDDRIGVTIWPQVLRMPDGGSREYRVVLNTEPTDSVTITVTRDDRGDAALTAMPAALTFSVSEWSTAQTVTVSAVEDADQVDGVAIFSHGTESNDEDYENLDDNMGIAPVTVTVDETRPRAGIQTQASAPVGGPFEVTIGFSEPVKGFELEDIEVSNGTASDFNRVFSRTYTVTITPEETGEVRVEVRSNVARDWVGNRNRAAEPLVIEADPERPEVTIEGPTEPVGMAGFEVTITFSEPVTGFEQSEITVTNGSVSGFSGSGRSYTAEITPPGSGAVTVEVAADVAEDGAGNGNRAAEPLVIEADLMGPEVEITSEATGPVGGKFEVTITFGEAVTGFEQSEITVTNGSVSGFSGSGRSYTAEITPSGSGAVTVEVAADVAEDGVGNGNRAAEPLVIEADLTGPEVEITNEATGPVGGAFEVTITFNEAVTGFEQSEITVTNGSVSGFRGSGRSYTAEITPSGSGAVTVEVAADVSEDGVGNGNRAAEPLVIEADLMGPEVGISSEATGPVGGAFEVTITFDEAVTGFEQSEITVTNGSVSGFRGSGRSYTAEITPSGSGAVTVEVAADVSEDGVGNGNRAAEPLVIEADLMGPEVGISSEATGPVGGAFEVTITFGEAVEGFEQSEITVTNGSVSGFRGSGRSYTAEITPSGSGAVTVAVAADVAEDGAGNGNRAAAPLVIEADLTGPEVGISSEATGPVGGAFEVTITFGEAVEGFEQSEITVTNGSVSGFRGSGRSYTAEITPSGSGAVTVEVAADVAEDGAGNGNRTAEPLVIEADLDRPKVTIEGPTQPVGLAGFEVTITFSEPVEGFEREDIQVVNGTVADFTEVSSSEYRVTIKPADVGRPVIVEVPENGADNSNQAATPFIIETTIEVSYAAASYTATEGGETVTVTVKLSRAGGRELAIPIRVTRPETTEVGDYTVEGLEDWDAQEGTGTLTFPPDETEQTWRIVANHDGDRDDETVELGFGELPEIVLAGEPSLAIVTLKDKGLVELTVSFGQAAYVMIEGQKAEIEVTVSPAADRRVEVPLVVALQGGTTPEDYTGIPASVVFEAGESQRTIPIEVLMDDVDDPGEGIVLSLGGLAEAVSAGDPSPTQVHFEEQRMAERFSQTLEGMAAVIARSTAVSAQTVIEGRFERHRQWSRLGSSVGAMPTPQPGSNHSAAALSPRESERIGRAGAGGRGAEGSVVQRAWGAAKTSAATGSGWDSENRETDTPGSWLRSLSLGPLGDIVRSGQTHLGASPGSGMEPSGRVYGQDRLYGTGVGDAPLGAGSGDFSGMRGQELSLLEVSFEMAPGESEKETGWAPVLWGQGDLQHFNGNLSRIGMDYRGGLEAAHIGLDLYANDKLLAGLSFMRSWGDLDYTDDELDGVLESRMSTVHPYLYWQPNERVSVWGISGFGRGQVAVKEPGRTHDFDADFRMLAGGVRAVLSRRGNHEWGLRADAFTARLETEALEDIAEVRGEAYRGRLMLEWVHDRELSVGRSLRVKAEAGGRFDGGDGERGGGVETGFRLGYLDTHYGLDVALHGRVLVVHESDYRDWGVGVQASWDPGKKQSGLRVSVMSTLGRDGGGRTTLWDNADAVMRPAGKGAMGIGSQYRMESEVAYAGMKALGLPGLLTPYSRLRWAGQDRELALGTAWSLPTRSQQALPLMFELEAIRRETQTGAADLALLARMSIRF